MNGFFAVAWNGYREARRNRVTIVVGAFLALLLLSSQLVTEVTVSTFDRVLTDFGLGMMSLILVFLAIFLSAGLLSREIERRTIFLIVSKPISRGGFLLARVVGNMIALTVVLTMMAAIFFLELRLYGSALTSMQFYALGGLLVELLLLTSAGVMMSSFAGMMVSALTVVGIYFAGHLASDIYTLSAKSESTIGRGLAKVLYYALPNLERLNFRPQASYRVPVELHTFLTGVGYGLAWSAVFLAVAIIVFQRRDFK